MDDDDFWITHIATTPEEDADFAGLGCRNNSVAPRLFGTPLAVSVILAVIGVRVESLTSAKVPGLVAHLPSAQREAPHPALVACA
jgi:hypothetical protein